MYFLPACVAVNVILLFLTVLFILGSSEFNKAYTSCKSCSNILLHCKIQTRQFTCLHSLNVVLLFIPIHVSARASTSQLGHPPLSQGIHLSARASTSQPGHPRLIQGIHLSAKASTSQYVAYSLK